MARGSRRARNYVRDANGRFASTGTTGRKPKPPRTSFRQRQAVSLARQRRQTGRLGSATREAKARLAASRKKLGTNASPQQKAAVTRAKRMAAMLAGERRIRTAPQAGVLRGAAGRGVKKGLKSRPQTVSTTPMSRPVPASQRPGSLTSTLRGTLRNLARTDAARIREVEAITGQKLSLSTAGAKAASETGARVRGAAKGGKVAGTLRAGLRELAQSDARTAREMVAIVRDATPKVAGAKGGKAIRGGRAALPAGRPAAAKQQPQRPSKKPVNKAQRAYLSARSAARSRGGDLQGADARSRRMANSAAAVVKGMERRRFAAVPKAPADSPRARQQQRQAARAQRAIRNQRAAMAREADGPGSKASRSATVARRAQQIYAGKVDPRAKTKSRLTRTSNPEALRKRIAKIKDNTARAAAKAATKAAKASAKPAKKESKRNISDAKAGRIIARLDANRPGLRKATGSDRRNRNLLQTYDRASKFVLAASMREINRSGGQSRMDLAESVRRAVRNAKAKVAKTAKPKAAKAVIGRVPTKGPGRGPLMKAKATPAKPSPKSPRIRTRIESASRPAGTVAKPRGMKPGVLAARRGVKAAPAKPQPQNKGPKGKKRWLSNDQVIQANEARGSGVRNTAEVMRSRLPKKTATALGTNTLGGYIARISGKPLSFDAANKVSDQIERVTGVGGGQLQGVRKSIDNARKTVTYSLSPVARKQAAIAEKVGSRKPRRRRSKP